LDRDADFPFNCAEKAISERASLHYWNAVGFFISPATFVKEVQLLQSRLSEDVEEKSSQPNKCAPRGGKGVIPSCICNTSALRGKS